MATLQQLGVQSLVFNPCGNTPKQGDFLDVMRSNVNDLGKVFGQDTSNVDQQIRRPPPVSIPAEN